MIKFGKIKKPVFQRIDRRGSFIELINSGQWQAIIYGKMKKKAIMGGHYHQITTVLFWLLTGEAKIKILNLKTNKKSLISLSAGQGYIFRPKEARMIKFLKTGRYLMAKSHRYNPKKPDLIDYAEKDFKKL